MKRNSFIKSLIGLVVAPVAVCKVFMEDKPKYEIGVDSFANVDRLYGKIQTLQVHDAKLIILNKNRRLQSKFIT